MFREGLKQDMKMLKHEVEMLPKEARKEALRQRKEEKEIEHTEKVGGRSLDFIGIHNTCTRFFSFSSMC